MAAEPAIDRIEPPNWWVGMKHAQLQLMLEGPGVVRLQARVRHPGVTLVRSQPGDSPNYLFLQLALAPQTPAGRLQLELLEGGWVGLGARMGWVPHWDCVGLLSGGPPWA